MKFLQAILATLFLTTLSASAEDPGLQRQETKQEHIREATARASAQLSGLVQEFERNGITGQDVDILTGIQSVLDKLSAKQMAGIVQLLQDARSAAPEATSTKIVRAYTGQKAVIVQLRQVLLEYQRQLALDKIARLIRELGDRQSTNLHEALAILSATSRQSNSPNTSQKISVQLQASEQTSIRDEIKHILKRLEGLASSGGKDDRPTRGMALSTERDLPGLLASATAELEAGKLMSAAGGEKNARDTLWQLADLLQSEKDKTNKLVEAAAEIEALIAAEKEVIEKTEKLDQRPEIPGEKAIFASKRVQSAQEQMDKAKERAEEAIKRDEAQLEKTKEQAATQVAEAEESFEQAKERGDEKAITQSERALAQQQRNQEQQTQSAEKRVAKQKQVRDRSIENAQKNLDRAVEETRKQLKLPSVEEAAEMAAFDVQKDQGETVDKTDFLKAQLADVSPEAAAQLEQSVAAMQEARAELGSNKSPEKKKASALPPERDALAKLESAQETVLAQLEEAQLASEVGPDTEGETQPDKAEQLAELLEKVQDLQKKQEELQASAEQHQAPQDALENLTSQAQQEAAKVAPEAASDLADAAEQMQAASEQIAANESPANEQQAASDALAQAAEKIQDELKALQEAKAELAAIDDTLEKLNPIIEEQQDLQTDTNQSSPDSQSLAEQQSDLQEKTAELGEEAANPQISEASQDQAQASEALAQNQPQDAQKPQAEALEDLNAAKDSLEQRREELAEALGQPSSPEADFSALEQAIANAQEQVSEGLEQIAGDQISEAAKPLSEAANTISPFTAGTEGALPAGVEQALENAQQALAESTAEAAAENAAPAESSAAAAQQALAEASAALTLAQAGLSAPAPSEQQASAPPGQPAEGEGEGKPGEGQKPGDKPGPANGDEGNWADNGGDGERKKISGTSKFIGLPARERGTIRQGTTDSYPAEYSSMIEQYLKNLSDQSGSNK
ncbi:MAG: hypothetical protein ACI9UA_002199 [Pseudoalteromonas tetraodonis]|jgi:hypothetical protein